MHTGNSNLTPKFFRFSALLFIFILFRSGILFSQTYFFDNYSSSEGLESKVFSILQDDWQFVWMGTKTGVIKFDGVNFFRYTNENGLAQGAVRVLFSDHNKNIWMGHEGGGISRWNGKIFEKIEFRDTLINSNITSIIQDSDNQIWITTAQDGALLIKNPNAPPSEMIYEHYLKGKKLSDQVFCSFAAKDGTLYFITNIGIKKYNKQTDNFESFLPDGLSTYFNITTMFEDSRGNLWFGTYNGGLYELLSSTNKVLIYDTHNGLAANWISYITEDSKGNIWIGHWSRDNSNGGISCIGPDHKIKVYNTMNGLHDNKIWCIKEDTEGNMLIGTTEHGLDIFKGDQFVTFSTKDGLINNQVNAIVQDTKDQIWFGTSAGVSIYNNKDDKRIFKNYNQTTHFISNLIQSIKEDPDHNIWIGTQDQGVMVYNIIQNRFIAQPDINAYLPNMSKAVQALEISPDGHLWIGTLEGLIEWDIRKNEYIKTFSQIDSLAGNDISALFIDSKNNLWVGSKDKGLAIQKEGVFKLVPKINNVTPNCITEDYNGKIWIGTNTKGVLVLDNDSIKQFSEANGLLANLINLIICDKNNNVYVGTNRGLNMIDQIQHRIITYTKKSGFVGIETMVNASFIDRQGNLWFGTSNGVTRYTPGIEEKKVREPVVHIMEMLVKGNKIEMKDGLTLASYNNDIAFRYSCISLTNPEGVLYQIKLDGLHDSWQDVKDQNYFQFNKLSPGRYVFNVRTRNNYGIWSNKPSQYNFKILAPFYKRGFFILIVIILILSGIILYIKIREQTLVREKRILEARVNERTLALSKVNLELSSKNKDIMDSITYAKRIQLAILPPDIPFDNTFILFKPKDIVSGDFYWFNSAGGKEFLAAVDCTGHGVPGAFMSFIGFTSLNKIIVEQGIYQPAAILNHLNEEVAVTLHQKGEDIVKDGMDIALACYSRETNELEYAGAFNPLIIARRGEIIEAKADRFAIGHSTTKKNDFTNHTIKLEHGDTVYLFSDGYADQFGGPDCKKFKTANLKELLASIHEKPMDMQRDILEQRFNEWKADDEQIDDVLIIGRKFNLE